MARYAALVLAALALAVSTRAQSTSANQSNTLVQAKAPGAAAGEPLSVSADTVFLAKLITNLDPRQTKPGDPVEAEAKQDIKQGKQVLLKKGSSLLGHVKAVQVPTAEKPEMVFGIVFDGVKMQKTGQQFSLHLIIQALAPEANVETNNSLADATGTGVQSATRHATVSGHASTVTGDVNPLTTESKGLYDLSGVRLGDQITQTGHVTVLAFSHEDIRLKKGTQLVMKVVAQQHCKAFNIADSTPMQCQCWVFWIWAISSRT
jgi:hypothetical protein